MRLHIGLINEHSGGSELETENTIFALHRAAGIFGRETEAKLGNREGRSLAKGVSCFRELYLLSVVAGLRIIDRSAILPRIRACELQNDCIAVERNKCELF